MVTVPKLNRLSRLDAFPGVDLQSWQRFMAIDQEKALQIEQAFEELTVQLIAIAAAQATADSKNRTFRQADSPTAEAVGDLWIDTDDGNKAYRWDGTTWVIVQDIGAAYALLAINPDGTIADDKVVTASVLDEAITTKSSAFTAGAVNISSGGYTWFEVQSATITSFGDPIDVEGGFSLNVYDNCKYQFRFLRDGTQLFAPIGPITVNTGDGPPAYFAYTDSPVAGTYEYTMEVGCNDAGDIDVLNRRLRAVEIKK